MPDVMAVVLLAMIGPMASAASNQVSFAPAKSYAAGMSPTDVTSADFNGDGYPDLAVANSHDATGNPGTVSVLINHSDGTFLESSTYTVGYSSRGITSDDLDGEGAPDIAVTNERDDTVSVLTNSNGTFPQTVAYGVGDSPLGITSANLDGDSGPDLAVANSDDGTVSALLNKGGGTFPKNNIPAYAAGDDPEGTTSADYNMDGEPDIAVTNASDATVSVLLNQGQGDLQASFAYEVGADNPEGITSADLDGDGRPDLATANSGSSFTEGNASVLLNTTGETETAGCTITGTERDDVLKGTKDQDIICGRGGNDRIKGAQGNDVIRGGRGDDILKGGAGKDVLWGGRGEDRLTGGGSRDSLYGGLDADRCAAGNDRTTGCERP